MTIRSFDNVLNFVERDTGSINRRELTSIRAMTAYVAHNQNVREETVRAFIKTEFGVETIAGIASADFERVIAFLTDLRCDLLTN
jgi:aspartyl-tRNA synthetase